MGVCNCSMFCCALLNVHSSIAIILMGKRELIALLNLSSWCLVMVERLFLAVPRGCLQFVIVVFPDHTHLLFLLSCDCLCTVSRHNTDYGISLEYLFVYLYRQKNRQTDIAGRKTERQAYRQTNICINPSIFVGGGGGVWIWGRR